MANRPRTSQTLDAIVAAASTVGLDYRGAFHPHREDGVPAPCGTLVLLGNAGRSMWDVFSRSPEHASGNRHALDAWSTRVVGRLGADLGAAPLMPFGGPPWWPFIRWAQRAEPVFPSPIGPLIHPEHGLWHAYRGALAFEAHIALPRAAPVEPPCGSCVSRPCLSACPVNAFTPTGYDVPTCVEHVVSDAGADCREQGCRARRACPVGTKAQYAAPQAAFHMMAFTRAHQVQPPDHR